MQGGTSLQFGLKASGFVFRASERVIWKGVGWTWASDSHHKTLGSIDCLEQPATLHQSPLYCLVTGCVSVSVKEEKLKCYFGLSEANRW